MSFTSTCDLLDEFDKKHGMQAAAPLFKSYGKNTQFSGKIVTVKVHNDNSLVKKAMGEDGRGKVLVVDGSGSLRHSLCGDMNAALATKNGWAGVVVYGVIRDSKEISNIAIGIKALGTIPRKTEKNNIGTRDIPVTFADCVFTPGHYLYSDEDGIVTSPVELKQKPASKL